MTKANRSALLALVPVAFLALLGIAVFAVFRDSTQRDGCTLDSHRQGSGDRADDWEVTLTCPGGKVYRAVWERSHQENKIRP